MSDHLTDDHEALVRDADRHRARLLDTLDALDRRRHDLVNVRLQLRRHALPLEIGGGVILLGLGLGAALIVHRFSHRAERARHERLAAVSRAFRHPENLARPAPPNFFAELGRKVLMGTLTFAALELTRRFVKRAMPDPA